MSLKQLLPLILLTLPVDARITRITVDHREAIATAPYEKLTGHAYGELDPRDPLNAIITDLQLAPRNARGMVEYSATFSMAVPTDLSKASGVMVYQVPNRGRIRFNDFFLKQGHVVLASGWQGDVAAADGVETIVVPVAHNADGSSITGPVVARFSDMAAGVNTLPILRGGVAKTAAAASFDTSHATLTRRASESGKVTPIRASDWAFADCAAKAFPGTADPNKICLKGGFETAYLYELTYTAKDPLVLGIGFAATRDLNSFFRYDTSSANFLAGKIAYAIGQGDSQSGNFLRTFIHLGFNQNEAGRVVFDGANPNIAARQLAMNIRFAAPGGGAAVYEAGSDGVVWWGDYADEARNRPAAGLLDRCRATDTCPKVVETFGSSEFYGLRLSPDLVGTKADRDIPLPSNVRRYYFPGVTHGGGTGGFDLAARAAGRCALPANPNPSSETMRALWAALTTWVVKGTPPPPSQYPRLDRGELSSPYASAMGFPSIPGQPLPDQMITPLTDYDFGPAFRAADLSGVVGSAPPVVRGTLPSLVPRVDADGNETAGVASVMHQVPLGTYLGWNVVASGFSKDEGCGQTGGYIPFAQTKAERTAAGDPRPSLEERYGTHEKFVAAITAASERMVRDGFLLKEDAEKLVAQAEASKVLKR